MKKIMMITALMLFPAVIHGMEKVKNKEILVTTQRRNLAKMISQSQNGCDDYQQYAQLVNTLKSHSRVACPLKKKEDELYLFHFEGDAATLEDYSDIIQVYTNEKKIKKLKENTEPYDQGFFVLVEEPTFTFGQHATLLFCALTVVWTTYNQWNS